MDSWERRQLGDLTVLKLRAEIEYRAAAYYTALSAAEAALAKNKDDNEMIKIQPECLKRIQR